MFRREPLEVRIARRQAELPPRRDKRSQFDQPAAKVLLVLLATVTVIGHVVGGILFAFLF
ncbi:hypothetical protein Acsp04_36850 [Actinomadura sp. NBRC 104425]|uniref:hypothetical protein n=1 Tax=Actinomadura sp. NBRC 104425 TaxID=3032204 RepID=UPI00249FCEC0|nr:hypothetical protein [Actinomadura sp. NBRC 104425]GLZ13450.1 hypothetical protein Acsp04_36850 [Actinomadura sp. NBRC 104425]